MLSPGDAALARRERRIPGLATLLDPGALLAALRERLPGVSVDGASPVYVHYKPATTCLVAYRLRLADTELSIYAKAYGADAQVKLQKSRRLGRIRGPLGPGAVVLDDLDSAIYFFPVDHRMPALRRMADPGTRRNLLKRLLRRRPELHEAPLHILTYKPERRYVARVESPQGPQALVKFYTPAGYAAARTAAQALSARGPLQLARLTGSTDRYHGLAYEWHPGRLLRDVLCDAATPESDKITALDRVGVALAELHRQAPDGLGARTPRGERERLQAQAATIAHLVPEQESRLQSLVRRMAARLSGQPPARRAQHGDFYDQQALVMPDGVRILDLDQAALGDPAADPGLFIAHLERHVLRRELTADAAGRYVEAFLTGYRGACEDPPSAAAIGLYRAMGLFYLAAEPFRYRESDWPARIEAMLLHTETLLAGCDKLPGKSSNTTGSRSMAGCLSSQ